MNGLDDASSNLNEVLSETEAKPNMLGAIA